MYVIAHRQPASPPGRTLPYGYNHWDDYWTAIARDEVYGVDEDATQGLKAMRLAPTLAVCRALLKGQPVPAEALDPAWAGRYGLTTSRRAA